MSRNKSPLLKVPPFLPAVPCSLYPTHRWLDKFQYFPEISGLSKSLFIPQNIYQATTIHNALGTREWQDRLGTCWPSEGKTMKSKKARETCSYLRLPDPEHIWHLRGCLALRLAPLQEGHLTCGHTTASAPAGLPGKRGKEHPRLGLDSSPVTLSKPLPLPGPLPLHL